MYQCLLWHNQYRIWVLQQTVCGTCYYCAKYGIFLFPGRQKNVARCVNSEFGKYGYFNMSKGNTNTLTSIILKALHAAGRFVQLLQCCRSIFLDSSSRHHPLPSGLLLLPQCIVALQRSTAPVQPSLLTPAGPLTACALIPPCISGGVTCLVEEAAKLSVNSPYWRWQDIEILYTFVEVHQQE